MNLVHGQHVFRVAGFNMELSDEGAGAFFTNGLGVTFPLVIDEVISKQLFKAHTATLRRNAAFFFFAPRAYSSSSGFS